MKCWAYSTLSSIIFQKRRSFRQTPASHFSSCCLAITLSSVLLNNFQFSYYASFALLLQNKTLHSWSGNYSAIKLTRLHSSSVPFLMIFSSMKSKAWYRNSSSSKNIPPMAKKICCYWDTNKILRRWKPLGTLHRHVYLQNSCRICQVAFLRGALHADLMSTDAEHLRAVHTLEWCALH